MSEGVIVALVSLAGVVFTAIWQTKSLRADFEKQSELADIRLEAKLNEYRAATDTKIDELTREVREHNSFARRVPVLEEQQRRNDKRLADLEAATR